MTLKVKFFDDFKWNQTILVSIDKISLDLFIETISNLTNNNHRRMSLTDLNYCKTYNTELTLDVSPNYTGLSQTANGFVLTLSKEGWNDVKDLLNELLEIEDGQGHYYIDYKALRDQTIDIDIVISVNEYPEDWIGWKE